MQRRSVGGPSSGPSAAPLWVDTAQSVAQNRGPTSSWSKVLLHCHGMTSTPWTRIAFRDNEPGAVTPCDTPDTPCAQRDPAVILPIRPVRLLRYCPRRFEVSIVRICRSASLRAAVYVCTCVCVCVSMYVCVRVCVCGSSVKKETEGWIERASKQASERETETIRQ
jgi:hypothetical protein